MGPGKKGQPIGNSQCGGSLRGTAYGCNGPARTTALIAILLMLLSFLLRKRVLVGALDGGVDGMVVWAVGSARLLARWYWRGAVFWVAGQLAILRLSSAHQKSSVVSDATKA